MERINSRLNITVFIITTIVILSTLIPYNNWWVKHIHPSLLGIYATFSIVLWTYKITDLVNWFRTKVVLATRIVDATESKYTLYIKGNMRSAISYVEFFYANPEKQMEEFGFTLDYMRCIITEESDNYYNITFVRKNEQSINIAHEQ